jgi:raffinose/stachyose/melibiose transport system substrate-binding protein
VTPQSLRYNHVQCPPGPGTDLAKSEGRASKESPRRSVAATAMVGISLIGLIAGTSASSASPTKSAVTGNGTTGTLTVQVQTGQQAQYACYIKAFKQLYPNMTVNTTAVSEIAKTGTNLEVLTSSGAPDIGIIPPESSVFAEMSAHHELVPLTPVWNKENLPQEYGPNSAGPYEVNGVPYLVSADAAFYNALYYNVPLFKKLGIAVPPDHRLTSLSELIAITTALNKAGYQGLAIAGESGYQASWLVDSYLNTSATPAQYEDYLTSWEPNMSVTLPYTAAPFVNALEAIQAMGKAGVFQTGYLGVTLAAQTEALFVQGKAGLLLDGEWTPATLNSDKIAFAYNWLLLPPVNGSNEKNKLSLFIGDDLGIPTKAQNPAAAMNFLDFVSSPKGQYCDLTAGDLPSIKTVPAADYSLLPPVAQSEVADVKQNGAQYGWSAQDPGIVADTFTDPLIQGMLNGQYTPQQIAAKVQANLLKYRAGKL